MENKLPHILLVVVLVLVLGFVGDFEDEDDENEEGGDFDPFSHRLFSPLQLQPRAALSLGVSGVARWLRQPVVSHVRLVREWSRAAATDQTV